ncbi:MAG: alpha/beta fold hydrolase [Patescibacteria group bacterium]
MKKGIQVIAIHGGDAYDTYEQYIESLLKEKIDYKDFFKKGWKKTLAEKLDDRFEVITPRFPNEANAKYKEWKIRFEKIIPFINDGVVLIGHSLGGMFLARYLAENKFPKKIKATMIVASPHTEKLDHSLADFIIPKNLVPFEEQGGEIFLYYSNDDPLMKEPMEHLKSYQRCLPNIHVRTFSDHGHFSGEEFPEIISDIKNLV